MCGTECKIGIVGCCEFNNFGGIDVGGNAFGGRTSGCITFGGINELGCVKLVEFTLITLATLV